MNTLRLLGRGLLALALSLLLGIGAALLLAPELLTPVEGALTPVYERIEDADSERLLTSAVALIGLMVAFVVAIRKLSGGGDAEPTLVDPGTRPPEAVSVDPATVSGAAADSAIDAVASLDDARDRREALRQTAVDALRTAGESPEDARRRVERGAWTDDDLAAGFLGDDAPVPLLARLRGWLDGAAEGRRRLVRSVDAVAALAAAPDAATRTAVEEGADE